MAPAASKNANSKPFKAIFLADPGPIRVSMFPVLIRSMYISVSDAEGIVMWIRRVKTQV